MLIWFPPVKSGKLCPDCAMGHCQGEHVAGNMRGVLHVMAERGDGIFGCRCAMGVSHGPQRGITDRRCVKSQGSFLLDAHVIERRQLHEEIMRVLAVDDGESMRCLAHLEEL